MKTIHLRQSFRLAACFAALLLITAMAAPRARAADGTNTTTVKFSDPTKPGTLRVVVKTGDITINGTDTTQVTVHTDLKPQHAPTRKDGLRVLSESATFTLTEKDNVVTLDTGSDFWFGAGSDAGFMIEVPRNTNVVVSNGLGGKVDVDNVTGDIEVKSLNGEISLMNVSGGALVETINGEISVNVEALHEGKPLSFTSMNGAIDIHVPADAKANVRLRTQNGAILTDFDEKALVTKTEAVRGRSHTSRITINTVDNSEIKEAVREAVRAGVEAAREAAEAMREAAQAAREAAQEARAGDGPAPAIAPVAPVAPVPPMTGGKLVSGTLNGGGPEISATAMNGDVTLRKAK